MIIEKLLNRFDIFPVTRYLFKSANVLKYMPHIKKHPEYNKRKTRRITLRKDDYEQGDDRVRKIIDSGKKDKK
jgi:hypothetical protein